MAKLLVTGTHGPEDPTRASMPYHVAKGAVEAGHEPSVVLMADGPLILKDSIREAINGVALPPLRELFQFAVEHNVHVYV